MERPRVWSKQLKLPCALEHAVLHARVFRRAENWTPSFIQKASASSGNCQPGSEFENGLVLPPEDPLVVALDRIQKHHDEVGLGAAVLRCWAKLVRKAELCHQEDDNDELEAEAGAGIKAQERDSLAVYEISDGILTETGSLLSGIELREVNNRSIKLLNVLACPRHKGQCSGCRNRYKVDAQSQQTPSSSYCTELGEVMLFNDAMEEDSQPTARVVWKDFALTLVEYHAYTEDWLPELILARSTNSRETVSLMPTSTDTLNLSLEIRITDGIRPAPVNWILNDGRPGVGTICQLTPTNETAIFLKTLRLQDNPHLEQRLLKGIGRLLGKRAANDLYAGVASSTGQPSRIIWALLWIPENDVADPMDMSTESFTSGRHRLWPKSLLSPLDYLKSNKNINGSDPPIILELAENHIGTKKPTALYNESLKIHEALQEYDKKQAAKVQEETKLGNDASRYSDIAREEHYNSQGAEGSDEYTSATEKNGTTIAVNDAVEDEDEDDLFASSPSPALAEESTMFQDPASGQEIPMAIDSVEQASASMFTPTHHSDPQYAPIKYDVSPTDPDGGTKVYQTGLETMITDDDFDFFDANAEIPVGMQQIPYEEYEDLSAADFGVNLNQPYVQPVSDWKGVRSAQSDEAFSNIDIVNALAGGFQTTDDAPDTPKITDETSPVPSARSDDDLWHHEENHSAKHTPTDLDFIPHKISEMSGPISSPRSAGLQLEEPSRRTLIESRLPPAADEVPASEPPIDLSMDSPSAPDPSPRPKPVDYSQPLHWSLVKSVEQRTPVAFAEVSFQWLDHQNPQTGLRSFELDGVCLADEYGDGRVRHRARLLHLLREGESSRQQRAHGRLSFHLDGTDLGKDAPSTASTVSDGDDVFADSADDASEITTVSSTQDKPDETQNLFALGKYPFPSDDHLLSTGFSVTLEKHDSTLLRKRVTESTNSEKRFENFCAYSEGGDVVNKYSDVGSSCPLLIESSDLPEYIAEDPGIVITTRVRVSQQGNIMELFSAALPYWSELSLEPISGRKDVIATVLYQKGIRMAEIKAFFSSVANIYATLNFGSHTLTPGGKAIQELGSNVQRQVSTLHKGSRRGSHHICYVLLQPGSAAASVLRITDQNNTINGHINGHTVLPAFIQDFSHPVAYCRLSSKVYHSLQRTNTPYQARLQYPSFIIAPSAEQSAINFAIRWPPAALDVIEGERSLHVAYSFDIRSGSLAVCLIDECGQAWREHECHVTSGELAAQEVWAYAMTFISMANVHWRLVIAREGGMHFPELKAWHFIFGEESQAASGAFQAELILCKARAADTDMVFEKLSRANYLSHRQCIFLDNSEPTWVSPLCSSTIRYGCAPEKRHLRTPPLDLHLLLRMSTESAGFMLSDMEVLRRIAHQFDGLRVLGVHRWFYAEETPLPAHLHAVQRYSQTKRST